jgi:hypothetical protein
LIGAALRRGGSHRVRTLSSAIGNAVIIVLGALILAGPLLGG